jgi:hypothetical protein
MDKIEWQHCKPYGPPNAENGFDISKLRHELQSLAYGMKLLCSDKFGNTAIVKGIKEVKYEFAKEIEADFGYYRIVSEGELGYEKAYIGLLIES